MYKKQLEINLSYQHLGDMGRSRLIRDIASLIVLYEKRNNTSALRGYGARNSPYKGPLLPLRKKK